MYSENTVMQVLYNGGLEYDEDQRGMISVMALTDVASGVKIKGLRYEYEGDMVNDVALGVSNEFCGRPSRVSVNQGALLIVREN
jgi:thiamine pyrophosphokinase